jgi:hypothetical protein
MVEAQISVLESPHHIAIAYVQRDQKLSIDHYFLLAPSDGTRKHSRERGKQRCKPDMTCNTGGYEGKRAAGKLKYRVVLFVTINALLPARV